LAILSQREGAFFSHRTTWTGWLISDRRICLEFLPAQVSLPPRCALRNPPLSFFHPSSFFLPLAYQRFSPCLLFTLPHRCAPMQFNSCTLWKRDPLLHFSPIWDEVSSFSPPIVWFFSLFEEDHGFFFPFLFARVFSPCLTSPILLLFGLSSVTSLLHALFS